jgi:hypothetical protein
VEIVLVREPGVAGTGYKVVAAVNRLRELDLAAARDRRDDWTGCEPRLLGETELALRLPRTPWAPW